MQHLTERQKEVLTYVLSGYNSKRIAAALFISEHTVKYHSRTLFHTFGATSWITTQPTMTG